MRRATILRVLLVGAAVGLPLIYLSVRTDTRALRICSSHGEALVEVREDGALCSKDGGPPVLR